MTKYNFDQSNPFADLEDDLDAAPVRKPRYQNPHVENIGDVEVPGFVEDCPKCRGTGTFYSYTGRPVGPCHKCKGTGKLQFKTSPDARAKARVSATKRKQRNAEEAVAALPDDIREWLQANAPRSDFAASLLAAVQKYGHLTEKQTAAVYKAIARDADAAEGFEKWADENEAVASWLRTEAAAGNEFAESLMQAVKRYGSLTTGQENAVLRNIEKGKAEKPSQLDISGLKGYYAVPDGDTRLKLCVRKPGKNSRYYGWTFVDDGAAYGNRRTYGKQAPDGLYVGSVQDALRAILDDPKAAQIAYGRLTGVCGVCGRLLEDEESVAAGIGPVCASKL